jgi:PAS domain S-box-containing protein
LDLLLSPSLLTVAAVILAASATALLVLWALRRRRPSYLRERARTALFRTRAAESQQRFQDFAEASSDWFWEMGPDLRFTYMSERLRDVLGFDPAYTIGKRREDLSDMSLEPEHWARHLEELRQHRPFRDFIYKMRLPDQRLRYINVSGKPIFDRRGRFLGYRGTGRDVTASVVSDQALRSQRDLILALVENLPFGVTLFDSKLTCIAVNSRLFEILEVPPGTLKVGDSYEQFVHFNAERGEYGPGNIEQLVRDRLALVGAPRHYERRRANGRVLEIRHLPMPDGGFVTTHLDITERKRAEERVRENESRFRDFAESSTDWLWEQDAALRFTYLSHGALERFGLSSDDFIGRRREDTKPLGVTDEQWAAHCADVEARRSFRDFRMARRDKHGRLRWCTISGWPIFDDEGRFAGYRGTGRDITTEVEAEQRATLAQTRLSAAIEALSDALAFFDADDRLTTCNEAFRRILGPVGHLAVAGAHFEELLRAAALAGRFPEAGGDVESFMRERMAYHRHPSGVEQRQLSDGSWIQIREQHLSDGSTALVAADITELKRQQDESAHKTATLEAMLANLSEGISVYDGDFRLVTFNRRWQAMLELPDDLARAGTSFRDVLAFMGRRGDFGDEPLEEAVDRRIAQARSREPQRLAKWYAGGRFIDLRRTPMPDGGFITVMSDLTELKSTEERFRDFAEATSDWFWEQDADLRFTYISPGIYEKTGITAEDHIGRTRRDVKPLGVSDEQWAAHKADMDARRPFRDFRAQRIDPQGRLRTLAVSGKPVFGPDGRFKGYRGSGADITERIDAEVRAKLVHARFGSAIESLQDALAIFDADDRLVMCNQAYREVVGGSEEVVRPGARFEEILRFNLDHGFLQGVVGDKESFIRQRVAQHHNPGEPFQMKRRDGGWLQIREQRLADGGIAVIGTDVTATKKHEQELFEKSEILQRTLANMGEGIIVFDRDLKLLAWNDRLIELLGLPQGFLHMGISYADFLRPQAERGEFGDGPVEELIRSRIERARSSEPFSVDRRRPNGRFISLRRNPMPGGGFVALYSDVTERRRAEDALRDAKEAAEIANRTKSEFLANMSHELRTPLNAIIGFSEIIQKEMFGPIGSPRYKEYASDIFESGTHLLNLINDILDVSKAEAGKIELQESQVLVKDLVDASLRLIMPRAREAGVTLTDPHVDHLPPLRADERRLKQVLINLLSNAVKFTPAGGRVSLDATIEPDGVAIRVRDTGIGMEAEDIPKALEPFVQVDSRLSRKYEGTGLGLPLSRALVELHGGRLQIESQPGHGTTVTVLLPVERIVKGSVATIHHLRRNSR